MFGGASDEEEEEEEAPDDADEAEGVGVVGVLLACFCFFFAVACCGDPGVVSCVLFMKAASSFDCERKTKIT
jgi:hypothetical protein